jgi:hypothetical protein
MRVQAICHWYAVCGASSKKRCGPHPRSGVIPDANAGVRSFAQKQRDALAQQGVGMSGGGSRVIYLSQVSLRFSCCLRASASEPHHVCHMCRRSLILCLTIFNKGIEYSGISYSHSSTRGTPRPLRRHAIDQQHRLTSSSCNRRE